MLTMAAWVVTARAMAADAPSVRAPLHVTVHAHERDDCGGPVAFWESLARRTTRFREAAQSEAAPGVDIEIARAPAGFQGTVRIGQERNSLDALAPRRVTAGTCGEVLAAASVMTALALEGDGDSSRPPQTRTPTPTPTDEAPVAERPEILPSKPWIVGAGAEVVASSMHGMVWGGGPSIELLQERGDVKGIAWLPLLRVRATFALAGLDAPAPLAANATLTTVNVDACPLRVAIATRWALRPCASFEGGALNVSVRGVEDARSILRPWLAAGASLRLAWSPSDPFVVAVSTGLVLPLVRDELKVAPSTTLFHAPVAAPAIATMVGVRFL